jgi:hypothetical protein
MKDAVDVLNARVKELENQITEIPQICRRYDKLCKGYMERIAELENEAENCKNYCLKLSKTVTEQAAEIERLRQGAEAWTSWKWILSAPEYKAMKANAERYQWGLEHPSMMANYFIKWRSNADHYNNRNPGVHPNDAIDAARKGE